MKIPLSPRLQACAEFVKPGDRIADIGCDHGYLSLYLIENGIASSAIAADINTMPLQSARLNAQKYGYSEKIAFYLSNGVQSIPHEFDTMFCAGMGADTIISIISDANWLKNNRYTLILQCQSKTPMLRKFLSDNGWYIAREKVLRDGRFLYTVMEVHYAPDQPLLTPAQCYFPPTILKKHSPEVKEYHRWVVNGLKLQTKYKDDPHLNSIIDALIREETP